MALCWESITGSGCCALGWGCSWWWSKFSVVSSLHLFSFLFPPHKARSRDSILFVLPPAFQARTFISHPFSWKSDKKCSSGTRRVPSCWANPKEWFKEEPSQAKVPSLPSDTVTTSLSESFYPGEVSRRTISNYCWEPATGLPQAALNLATRETTLATKQKEEEEKKPCLHLHKSITVEI